MTTLEERDQYLLPCSWRDWVTYLTDYWWPAVKRDPTQYNYWRDPPAKRMGRFRIVSSRDQEVLQE